VEQPELVRQVKVAESHARDAGASDLHATDDAAVRPALLIRRGNRLSLRVTGPASIAVSSSLVALAVISFGQPMQNPSQFVLSLLACVMVGASLSLLLTNSRILDFQQRIEDFRYQLDALRADQDRRDARIRTYEEAILKGNLKIQPKERRDESSSG